MTGIIDVDGSTDNTHMFAKYTLEESKKDSNNIKILVDA
jgi:predicted transcriptional regulator